MDDASNWYLIFTKPRQEFVAKTNLENQKFEIYLPLLTAHKRIKNLYQVVTEPLFPRYIFVSLNSQSKEFGKIRSTRGCISIVKFGNNPAVIPPELVKNLKENESNRKSLNKAPEFKIGDKVRMQSGILCDYEGIVQQKNSRDRVTILLNISSNHTKYVNISIHNVGLVN